MRKAHRRFTKPGGLAALCLGLFAAVPPAQAQDEQCKQVHSRYAQGRQSAAMESQMAFCAARAGDADEAFARLGNALEKGLRDHQLVAENKDFLPLHKDPRWAPLLQRLADAEQRYLQSINTELKAMYEADQADRKHPIDWSVVGPRDDQRRARVLELASQDKLKAPDDYYRAALVMQHGKSSESYAKAMQWARQAWALQADHLSARWLSAAAEDRYLQSLGKPQVWGTQFSKGPGEADWTLEPFDRQAKTDAERQAMNVPVLAEALRAVERMNAPQPR